MIFITLILGKTIGFLCRVFHFGSGGTWPGHVALRFYPGFLNDKGMSPSRGVVLVSGTNGKTTVTKMVSHVLRKKGFLVTTNASGANLENGLASAIILSQPLLSKKRPNYFVLEVDEFTLPIVLEKLKPTTVVLLNISRDQLDRYGETDLILERWEYSLRLSAVPYIVLDKSLEYFRKLSFSENTVVLDFNEISDEKFPEDLSSLFYSKNLKAALAVLLNLGVPSDESLQHLSDFQAAYGRGEVLIFGGKIFHIFLAKNPASLSNNLRFFEERKDSFNAALFILNDNIPDGRDVSWIYDVSPRLILSACGEEKIFISGKRCYDMAVRLKYAGLDVREENVSPSLQKIRSVITADSSICNVAVFPNYSAMLEFRKLMLGRKIL
ncbi:MAG: hypothetical protein KatS3mg101_0033 [Patescibacteria group bacterium]|nr:MAG: hypothetical protein KatS3mg101_0033 [Patescibacteria group bacterium]